MKKLYKSLLLGLLAVGSTLPVTAQQVPNADFEGGWVDCIPWTTDPNSKAYYKTPASWCISHVSGMSGTGATEVGKMTEGYESESAVYLINTANPYRQTQIVPGYLTLGTTWSTSIATLTSVVNSDGGSYGGVEFTNKPDALTFKYKRTRGTSKPNEITTILAYTWKGTYVQKDVPGNIVLRLFGNNDSRKKADMQDRDRNIIGDYLGISSTGSEGGEITQKGSLVSALHSEITENAEDWTDYFQEFDYVSNETPEKLNIVISAGDYFGGASSVGKDNSLTVDNIKLVYFSRLESLTAGDITVTPDEDATVTVDAEYDADAISLKLIGQTAEATSEYDEATGLLTVTVSNVDADRDGKTSHVYTFQFKVQGENPEPPVELGDPYTGYLNVQMTMDGETGPIAINKSTTIYINHEDNGTCTFTLPNFNIAGTPVGDIIVPETKYENATDGSVSYTGKVENMELLGGGIVVDVAVNGTINDDDVNMNIDVTWFMTEEIAVPIDVTFTTKPLNATTYDGYLNVEMMGAALADNDNKQIIIFPTLSEENEPTCTFLLPDFKLEIFGDQSLGDIVVDNVTTTQQCDIVAYEGYVPALELAGGELVAEVSLEGTINDNNIVKMFIDVVWDGISIPVTFTTNEIESTEGLFDTEEEIAIQLSLDDLWKLVVDPMDNVTFESDNDGIAYVSERNYIIPVSDGVCNITATRQAATRSVDTKTFQVTVTSTTGVQSVVISTANGETEYYDLRGVKVDINNAPAGIYISRQGNKAVKFVK